MERIKQAVEKARAQRGAAAAPGPSRSGARLPRGEAEDLDTVLYRHTRVVRLDPLHLERHRIIAHSKDHLATGAFDLLRTQALLKMEEKGWRTLAVTSPTPGAGKTMVAINLAMSIAQHTHKTAMLVDFDLRKPRVGQYLGLEQEIALDEVLADRAGLPDALVNPGLPRLVVLPTRAPVPQPAETLASVKVSELITELRERYESRIVIFDLPPVLNTDDAIAVLPQMDCVLMVVGNGMSAKGEIEDCRRLLPAASLLGVVLNKAEAASAAYS